MFCPKCGHDNPDDARFCGNCSFALPQLEAQRDAPRETAARETAARETAAREWVPPPVAPRPEGGAVAVPVVSSGMNWGIIIASLIIPFVGIIMGIIYLADANPAKKAAGRTWLIVGIAAAFAWWLMVA